MILYDISWTLLTKQRHVMGGCGLSKSQKKAKIADISTHHVSYQSHI